LGVGRGPSIHFGKVEGFGGGGERRKPSKLQLVERKEEGKTSFNETEKEADRKREKDKQNVGDDGPRKEKGKETCGRKKEPEGSYVRELQRRS